MHRRSFLKTCGSALAASSLPTLWLPSRAKAATRAFGTVEHLLVLYAKGGLRSHCVFNAVGTQQHNPFGSQPGQEGTEWTLGAACGADDIVTSFATIPALAKITGDVAVVPCVDHMPGSPLPDADHRTAAARIATGDPLGTDGLLTRIGQRHPRYAEGFSIEAMPPVEIGPTEFGGGAEDAAKARPLSMLGAGGSFAGELPVGKGWKLKARDALDQRFMARTPRAYSSRVGEFLRAKGYAAAFADVLGEPLLDVLGQPEAQGQGMSNGQLIEALGTGNLAALGDTDGLMGWGAEVAFALRFFAFGVPACVVTRDIYDMHDNEAMNFAPRVQDLARQLAGLNYLLKNLDHPRGGKFWDRTMVVVLSEFSRNNTGPQGFNSGNGSDHVLESPAPCRNQAMAFMGGPVTAGGRLLGATDQEMNALDKVYSSRSLLSTLLDVQGLSHEDDWEDPPIEELFA